MNGIDYSFFSQHSNCPSHLTNEEILNPFLVLEELFGTTNSLKALEAESWQLMDVVFHQDYCLYHDEPLSLYYTYKKLLKLLEALCLITDLRPIESNTIKGTKKATFDKTIRYTLRKGNFLSASKEPEHSYEICQCIIEDRSYGEWKAELELWLYGGLDPSGGRICKAELANYAELYLFMEAAFNIYLYSSHELSMDEQKTLNNYVKFSINTDRPTKLDAQDINEPFEIISCSLNSYSNVMELHQDFSICHDLLVKRNHWKEHFDYGNLLLIFNDIERIIDAIWLIYKKDNPKEEVHQHADRIRHQLSDKVCSAIHHLTEAEINFPYLAIIDFFRFKPLNQWKLYLDQWLQYSLSNQSFPSFYNESKGAFKQVLKLLEVTYLSQNGHYITYRD